MAHSKKLPYAEIESANLFEFCTKEYTLVLVGYPVLRAFTVASGSDIWVDVYPKIDVKRRIIFLPKIKEKQNKGVKTPLQKVSLSEDHTLKNRKIYLKNVKNMVNFLIQSLKIFHLLLRNILIRIGS